jgi:hypothetical protein
MIKIYTCVATEAVEKKKLEKQIIIIIANEPKYILIKKVYCGQK